MKKETRYIANDGKVFYSEKKCLNHEEKLKEKDLWIKSKIGDYERSEVTIGPGIFVNKVPMEVPWVSVFGACMIMITDIRRKKDKVEFQLGDEKAKPYEDGNAWVEADAFYEEWPQ